jgi:predicted nucleic acid-binding protein
MMNKVVIDTNVLLSADSAIEARVADHVPLVCRLRALEWLESTLEAKPRVVVDTDWRILKEYENKLRTGDYGYRFLHEAHRRALFDFEVVQWDEQGYALLPPALAEVVHDRSDRKFVAVALESKPHPPIVNCADSDWLAWESELARLGIIVEHLCPIVGKSATSQSGRKKR